MGDPETRTKKVADFLRTLTRSGGLNLNYKIVCNGQVQPGSPAGSPAGVEVQSQSSEPAGAATAVPESSGTTSSSTSPSPETPASVSSPEISVDLSGPDVPLLLARNGELLLAIEHIAAKILRFEHEEHDRISFDANSFKVLRHQELRMAAEAAVERVRRTGQPFSFAPMSSRERRILHLELASSGLVTASSGEGSRRFVVLYPEQSKPASSTAERSQAIRSSFRRR
jgi:spoIIIJ-associated protein